MNTARSRKIITLHEWHKIILNMRGQNMELNVDDQESTVTEYEGCRANLNGNRRLSVGLGRISSPTQRYTELLLLLSLLFVCISLLMCRIGKR